MITNLQDARPRCQATVDLISRVQRPYLFRVTVEGEAPHAYRRVYTVAAPGDIEAAADSAAMKGLELFIAEASRPLPGLVSLAPKAKLA